jgi:hypothetical protein
MELLQSFVFCCLKLSSLLALGYMQVLHPQGHYAVTSSRSGKLSRWDLQPVLHAAAQVSPAAAAAAAAGSFSFHGGGMEEPAAAAAAAAAAAEALAAAGSSVVKSPLQVEQAGLEGSVVDCMRFLSGKLPAVEIMLLMFQPSK